MRAIVVERFGGAEQLRPAEHPDPRPRPGQVVIDVEAVDTLFLDTMLRSGNAPEGMRPELPWIPGNGAAGVVTAVGDGVEDGWVGRRVGAHTGGRGAYAQRVAVPVEDAVPVPEAIDVATAAALLHDGPTALRLLDVTRVARGDAVLVLGAAGGLGVALVQLTRARGARVVAVARGEEKRRRVAELGPDAVVDSDAPDWPRHAREALGDDGADVVLDNVGAALGAKAATLLARGGRYSAHGTPSGAFTTVDAQLAREREATVTGIETVQLAPREMAELTAAAYDRAAAGELRPLVGQTFALERAADAHVAIETRTTVGKTLLIV